jgi:hypothetical protein
MKSETCQFKDVCQDDTCFICECTLCSIKCDWESYKCVKEELERSAHFKTKLGE